MHSKELRFLHTADWQIGRQYQRFESDDAAALFEARFSVVEQIARRAARDNVDAVLVAGDVFDVQTVSDRTIRRLFNALHAFDGPWIMISGNHDAALAESVWTRARKLDVVPENVMLALTPEPIILHDKRLAILPAPLTQRQTHTDLTAWFDHAASPDGFFRIGIAHGSVMGILSDQVDSSNPIAADRASRARLDYLALGDWHGLKSVDARTWYSGTPETDRFRNNESAHILDVRIESPGALPQVQPVRMGQYIWDEKTMHLSMSSDLDQIVQYLQTLTEGHVVSLLLTGRTDLAGQERLLDALGAAQARARALDYAMHDLSLHPTDDDIAALRADGYVAEVLTMLRTMQESNGNAASDDNRNDVSGAVSVTPARPHDDGSPDLPQHGTITPQGRIARDALVLLADIMQQDKP